MKTCVYYFVFLENAIFNFIFVPYLRLIKSVLSNLSNKSIANLNASNLLITNKLYASSVHCSYYAVLQHMTCKLKESCNITFEELANKSENDDRTSHRFILEEIIRELTIKANMLPQLERNIKLRDFQRLKNKIKNLKALRIESDYRDIEIDSDKGNSALISGKQIIFELDTHFK